ncbi:MAG: hypothetical protein WA152_02340 [Microgenomates group bacterium]
MKINYWKISGNLIILTGIVAIIDFFIIQKQTNILIYLPLQLFHILVGYSLRNESKWALNVAMIFSSFNLISFTMFLPKIISTGGLGMVFYFRTGLVIAYSISIFLLWIEKNKKIFR